MPTFDSEGKKVFGLLDQLTNLFGRTTSPLPVNVESRNGFSVAWFRSQRGAEDYVQTIMQNYTGGLRFGRKAERCTGCDYNDETHGQLFAVRVEGLK